MSRGGLRTADLFRLDRACAALDFQEAFGAKAYLVGSAQTGEKPYHDVDVRVVLDDERFDALFGTNPALWQVVCVGIGAWLAQQTGLPIDFQVQRMTEANEKFPDQRNPLGIGMRNFAGLGDATRFEQPTEDTP